MGGRVAPPDQGPTPLSLIKCRWDSGTCFFLVPNAVDILEDLTPKPHAVRTGPDAPPASTR